MRALSRRLASPAVAIAAAVFLAPVVAAQEAAPAPTTLGPLATWRVGITAGALAQPTDGGGGGGALSAEVARRLGASRVSLVGLFIGAEISDVGPEGPNRYIYDGDWRIAALGLETAVLSAPRIGIALGLHGAMLWSRTRRVGQEGTPTPDPTTATPTWDEGAALIPSAHVLYRISGPLALSARLAGIQRIGQDNFMGDIGGFVTAGAAIAW